MKKINNSEILISKLEDFISKNRRSLSDEDKVLLKECIEELKNSDTSSATTLKVIDRIVKWFLIGSKVVEKLNNVFHFDDLL